MDKDYLLAITKKILAIPSPSGYTEKCRNLLITEIESLGFKAETNNYGNVIVNLNKKQAKTIGISAHFDTLGAMVSGINNDGTLAFKTVGGPILPTYDGEYCTIHTRDGKTYNGTFLSNSPSSHVYKDATSIDRNSSTMHVRIDELVCSKNDVKALGINNGDYISLDPKTIIFANGFIKSRFLDDKICVSILLTLLKYLKDHKITLNKNLVFVFSCYEEVGFGASSIPQVDEFIACDMGCVGANLEGSATKVSICSMDSSGPYDYELTGKLIASAKEKKLDYAIDVYPYYGSDVSAARRAGHDFKGALIGPGVEASHGMERTHLKGVLATLELLITYLTN
ncbi:MAG: M42 family metallopeptidase [Erysipelotrichales bacterium]|nr:M42 family metallopeptidase [Erysipelotrichales bacterium]